MERERGTRRPDRHKRRLEALHGHPSNIPRHAVYNDLPPVHIDPTGRPTEAVRRQADVLFERIKEAECFKTYKLADKRAFFQNVLHALKQAMHQRGTVLNHRNAKHPAWSKARIQVIEAMIEQEMVYEHRSPPGSPRASRLLPMPMLQRYADDDPWVFDPERRRPYVHLNTRAPRERREELPVDWSLPIARETQERLELINEINSRFRITYHPYNVWDERWEAKVRRLRPVHVARFTERWDWHGRLYTPGRYGHQRLRGLERGTIEFDDCPSVELDYGGLHPRLLYHLVGHEYAGDPYAAWGPRTTPPQRAVAKRLLNAAINATGRRAAIAAFNNAMRPYGPCGRKRGNAAEQAARLRQAYRETGVRTGAIYERLAAHHRPIAHYFGTDAGIWLMRLDSAIAIDVMYHFARQCIPCLGVHDSFIVPAAHAVELREVMLKFYQLRFGFLPAIRP